MKRSNFTSNGHRTFLALGDSYTIGESISEQERWYRQLIRLLEEAGIGTFKSEVIAQTGWTTGELLKAIDESGNTKKYSLVSLLIGVNNQYRGQSLEGFRNEFTRLLEVATCFADDLKSKVLVLSIPDWGVTPFGLNHPNASKIAFEIDQFNQVAEEQCSKAGILFINITDLSKLAKHDASLIAEDQLHFSGKMYAHWARAVLPYVQKILTQQ